MPRKTATQVLECSPPAAGTAPVGKRGLSVRDAALRLGVCASVVYRMCADGNLAHERVGLGRGGIRIDPREIDDYLQLARRPRRRRFTWAYTPGLMAGVIG